MIYKYVSKTHFDKRGVQLQHVQHRLFKCNISVADCMSLYSTQGIENEVSARLPNITSASCDIDL